MTKLQIKNATEWSEKVLNYDDDVELLGTNAAKLKANRYLKLVNQHERKTGECIGKRDEPLSDSLCSIKYGKL